MFKVYANKYLIYKNQVLYEISIQKFILKILALQQCISVKTKISILHSYQYYKVIRVFVCMSVCMCVYVSITPEGLDRFG